MMKRFIYGVDIGGTTVKIGLFDTNIQLLDKWEIPTNKVDNGKHILADIALFIQQKTPNLDEIYGYGFGVPGPVLNNHINLCVNLGWKDLDIRDKLHDVLKNDWIFVANDANVATLGEAFHGAGHGRENVAMITLGTGVGSGIISHGKIVEGASGFAGEIGHLTMSENVPFKCNCGKTGCLETVASATGVKNLYHYYAKQFKEPYQKLRHISAKSIFDAAKSNDPLATFVVDRVAHYVAYSCHVLSLVSDPEVILIGGGLSKAGDFFMRKIKNHLVHLAFPKGRRIDVEFATLGNDAGMYGAAQLVKIRD